MSVSRLFGTFRSLNRSFSCPYLLIMLKLETFMCCLKDKGSSRKESTEYLVIDEEFLKWRFGRCSGILNSLLLFFVKESKLLLRF
jgi:hypothetical protein